MPVNSFLFLITSLFIGSLVIAYLIGRLADSHGKPMLPEEGAVVRIKCTHGVYRSRFLGAVANGWRLTAPLSRDAYVPFRPGEQVLLEAATANSAFLARSLVVARDLATHELVVSCPRKSQRVERREARRVVEPLSATCQLEGTTAGLIDVSRTGARVATGNAVSSGERVRLDLPWLEEPVFAWILEVLPAPDGGGHRSVARLRFEDPIDLQHSTRA